MTGILNARIVASIAMLVFVGAAIAASTGAFFSDTETSTGNTFTAGDVDITISDLSHNYLGDGIFPDQPTYSESGISFALGDLKPLDEGTITYTLGNGTNDAYLCAAVVETGNNENTRLEPETSAGDTTDGAGNGELGQFLSFMFGSTTTTLNGAWQSLGVISASGSTSTSIGYCFGTYVAGVCTPNASPTINQAQTDSVTADVQFYAVQTRNNPNFTCASLPPASGGNGPSTSVVSDENLFFGSAVDARSSTAWLFYNDTNDTVMSLNQFSGGGGINDIVAGPDSVGAAQMQLDDASSRYNIATFKYKNVKLSDIGSLNYRIYDDSASAQTPYLHFNVDFNNSDTWQNRLVQVPTGVVVDTWTTVNALAGSWTYSGATWPAPINQPGTTPKTWAEILAAYPNAETRSTDSFLGVRVGHPGPDGENSYVDWIEFDGETTDFED